MTNAERDLIRDYIARKIATAIAELDVSDLRKQIDVLRAASWQGVWSPTKSYERGNRVTAGGCLFHCNASGTTEKPGSGDAWTQMTKNAR